jgi:signal transduction histidine kinase
VDGRGIPLASAKQKDGLSIEVPAGDMSLYFESSGTDSNTVQRYCFKLEGCDTAWRELEGWMRVVVVFFDNHNDWLSEKQFLVKEESPGWTGDPSTSPLTIRRETVTVPERALTFSITLSSAGPSQSLGTLGVGALKVTAVNGAAASPVLDLSFPPASENTETPTPPLGWIRQGMRPSMAHVYRSLTSPSGSLLLIVDEDPMSHAEWQSPRVPTGVQAGESLQLEWAQCYSIGFADMPWAIYNRVEPGHYLFRLRSLTASGRRTGQETTLSFVVYPPFWQRAWFLVLCGMLAAGAVLGVARYLSWRRTQRELVHLRQQNALEMERARIARDIHDDLGSTLTHISMLSQAATPESTSFSELAGNMTRINRAAQEMTQAMDEIVWAINPKNDRLYHLVTYLDAYAQTFLASAGIDFRCDYPEHIPERTLSAPSRHSLFLAFKEALTNAARHAACHTVHVVLRIMEDRLTLTIADDGKGFVASQENESGNGVSNMRRRLETLGGRCRIESALGKGTTITFEMTLERE